jgi:hypothetical protein
MNVPTARSVTGCLLAAMLASGCVRTVQPYPSAWRGLGTGDCNAIVGTYDNLGEGGKGGRGEALFTLLVAVYDHQQPRRFGDRAPGVVTISMPEPGVLEARTRTLSQRFLARNREYECSEGVLEFARTGGTSGNAGTWYGSSVVRVAKDEAGWLVVSRDEAGFALLGYVLPVYMSFLTWTRFPPATEARAAQAEPEAKVQKDAVDVLALTRPEVGQALRGFTEFEMSATVRYALRSADRAALQVFAVVYESAGCVPRAPSTAYAGSLLPITRGEGVRLVPVRWRVRSDASGVEGSGPRYVTVRSALFSDTADPFPRLIRSFWQPRAPCYALPAPGSGQGN